MCSRLVSEFNIHNPPPDSVKFGRTKDTENKYLEFRKDKTIHDIIFHIKNNIIKKRWFCIVKNDFPYNVPYEHYLLWINPKVNFKVTNDFIMGYIENHFQRKDIICFENLANNKSILEIRHFHIFMK